MLRPIQNSDYLSTARSVGDWLRSVQQPTEAGVRWPLDPSADQFDGSLQVEAAGAPERHSPGFWHNSTMCCGTAGFIHWGVGLWCATGQEKYLAFARRAADQLVGDVFTDDGQGARWYDAFTRTQPDDVAAQTGLVGGSAGGGLALLHLYRALQGDAPLHRLPDEPWPAAELAG